MACGLSTEACADLLHVTERTVRNWESGSSRIPYAAFKLMRVLRGGKFLGPEWSGWFVRYDKLVTPEGHEIRAHEFAWWSLLVRQAREFQRLMRERRQGELAAGSDVARGDGKLAASTATHGLAECAARTLQVAPLANAPEGALASSPSILRALGRAAGKDPSAELPARTSGLPASRALVGQRPSKSLKRKRNPTGSLSLTLPKRPEKAGKRAAKAVRP